MVKKLIQLVAVLTITLLLAAGCASTIVNEGPFDFSVMREMEEAGQRFAIMSSRVSISDSARNQYDMAWTRYHAGQVAIAQGHYQEAQDYFETALAGIIEAMTTVSIEAMLEQKTAEPRLSF